MQAALVTGAYLAHRETQFPIFVCFTNWPHGGVCTADKAQAYLIRLHLSSAVNKLALIPEKPAKHLI